MAPLLMIRVKERLEVFIRLQMLVYCNAVLLAITRRLNGARTRLLRYAIFLTSGWARGSSLAPSSSTTRDTLQQSNGDISLDSRDNTNVRLQIQLDMNLQAALDILVAIEPEPLIRIFIFALVSILFITTNPSKCSRKRAESVAYIAEATTARGITRCIVDRAV